MVWSAQFGQIRIRSSISRLCSASVRFCPRSAAQPGQSG